MTRQQFFIGFASIGALTIASAFNARPDLNVVNIIKSECKMVVKNSRVTYQKQIHLNLTASNLSDFSGQTVYYCFFNSSNTLVETASAVVGANPQIVVVSILQNGQAYSVTATTVTQGITGPGQKLFTGNFKCAKTTQTGGSSGGGTQNK